MKRKILPVNRRPIIHLCSFTVGIDELPQSKQRNITDVLRILAEAKRFSVFEATANPIIAKTMDRMQGKYFTVTGGAYPWCEIELTDLGRETLNHRISKRTTTRQR